MFVLVADHGISFRPNTGRRRAADPNLDQLAFVPLFLKFPGQERGGTDSTPVQTIDIVPTIAQELGVQIPWEVDGVPVSERPAAVGDEQIDVVNYRGAIVSQSLATLLKRRQRFAEQQNKIFRTGRGWNALIESGPGSELIGTRPPESIPESEAEADLILSGDRDDPDSVDAVVAGRLRGLEPGRPIAIEVNGRIAATTASVAGNEGVRYEAVLPPRVYERFVDEVRVLLVRPGGGFELLGSA